MQRRWQWIQQQFRTGLIVGLWGGIVSSLWLRSGALGAEPVVAQLTFAPIVPAPITRREPAQVVVNLAIEEKVMDLSDGIQYEFWTYNGRVPGPFIRLRQGDAFEVHLDNSKGKLTHTVDFHAVTGPGGGAGALMADPVKPAQRDLGP